MAGFLQKDKGEVKRSGGFGDLSKPTEPPKSGVADASTEGLAVAPSERALPTAARDQAVGGSLNNIDDTLAQNDAEKANPDNPAADPQSRSRDQRQADRSRKDSQANNRSTDRFRDNQANQAQKTAAPAATSTGTNTQSSNSTSSSSQPSSGSNQGGVAGLIQKHASKKGNPSFMRRNRKGAVIGVSAVGLIIASILGFIALLPLKIESMVQGIFDHEYAHVEHAIERRAEKIFIKYALQNALTPEGGIVSTGNPLGDLYKTWRLQQSEGRFLNDNDVKISKGSSPRSIKLTTVEGTENVDSEAKLADYLDKDLTGKKALAFIDQVVKDQTKWIQFYKRRHLRAYYRNAYDIRKWYFFDKSTPDADVDKAYATTMSEDLTEGYDEKVGTGLECAFNGDSCPDETGESPDQGEHIPVTEEGSAAADATGAAIEDAAADTTGKEFAEVLSSKLLTTLGSKVIPVIGWIDLGARLDDFLWNNKAVGVIKSIRGVQYASVAATWLIINDQIKAGDVSTAEVDNAAHKLDNMTDSEAYQKIVLGRPGGTKVDSNKAYDVGVGALDDVTTLYKDTGGIIEHPPLHLYLITGGKLMDLFGGVVGWLIHWIPGVSSLEDWVSKFLISMLQDILGPVITATSDGLTIANAFAIGSDVSAQQFMHDVLGGALATVATEQQNNDDIAARDKLVPRTLGDRLWSTDDPNSFVARLATILPGSPAEALQGSATQLLAIIANPVRSFTGGLQFAFDTGAPSVDAASTTDEYGVSQFDYTDAQLSQDVDADLPALQTAADTAKAAGRDLDALTPDDCPAVPAGQTNICKLDVVTIQSLKSQFTATDDGGINSGGGGN